MNGPKALSVLVSVLGAEKVVGKRKKVFADGSPAKSKIDGFSAKSKVCCVLCKHNRIKIDSEGAFLFSHVNIFF